MNINKIFGSTEKFVEFQKLQGEWALLKSSKQKVRFRRNIRFQLFRLRSYILKDIAVSEKFLNNGIREWIQHQLQNNLQQNWETFTFTWDIAPNNPFTVITINEWQKSGGNYDEHGFRVPPGFTEQEL